MQGLLSRRFHLVIALSWRVVILGTRWDKQRILLVYGVDIRRILCIVLILIETMNAEDEDT
jgi:hypothetical protein